MNIAMWVGMAVGWLLFMPIFAAFGTTRDQFRIHHPALSLLLMGFEMIAGMVAWMRYRGHSWRSSAEMTAAMLAPAVPLIACLQVHALSASGPAGAIYMASMPFAMLALMLYRRSEYSMHM
jgi:hypothetical protein